MIPTSNRAGTKPTDPTPRNSPSGTRHFLLRTVNQMPLPSVIHAKSHQLAQRDIRMPTIRSTIFQTIRSASLLLLLAASVQARSLQPARPPAPVAPSPVANESDLADTRAQLMRLLRMSPTLSEVVANDPSLLANQD